MWAPSEVVDRHKRRAIAVWVALIALILAYTVWLFVEVEKERQDPSVSIHLEAERYPFPTMTLCPIYMQGCDVDVPSWYCAASMIAYVSIAKGFNDTVTDWDLYEFSQVYNQCIDVRLSNLTEVNDDIGLWPPGMSIHVEWDLGNSTTTTPYIAVESVLVFMTDPEVEVPLGDHNMSTFIGEVPYSRIEAGDIGVDFKRSTVIMEMTESQSLDGTTSRTYSAGSVTPVDVTNSDGYFSDEVDYNRAIMLLDMYQPSMSKTVRREIDPLEWTEIFGNVGGFWELMLLLWGVFFISAGSQQPRLKGRNFIHSGQRAVQTVRTVATDVVTMTSSVRRRRSSVSEAQTDVEEAVPAWDAAGRQNQALSIPAPAFNPSTSGRSPPPMPGFQSRGHRTARLEAPPAPPQPAYWRETAPPPSHQRAAPPPPESDAAPGLPLHGSLPPPSERESAPQEPQQGPAPPLPPRPAIPPPASSSGRSVMRILSGRALRVRPANHQDDSTPRAGAQELVDASNRTPVAMDPPLPHRVTF